MSPATPPPTGYRTIIANNISYDNVTKAGAHSDGNGIIIDDFQNTQTSGARTTPTRPWYRTTWSTGTAARESRSR